GTHVPSFRQGLRDVLREDPDIIFVGEMREPETIRLTLDAAESGHLVIASFHAASAEDAIHRICNSFPLEAQDEMRFKLASSLSWVVIQQLIYMDRLRFRVPLLAILRGTQSVKGLIRENRLPQIENAMHMGKAEGMFTKERYREEFLNQRKSFNLPSNSFRPSPELLTVEDYRSQLIGSGIPIEADGNYVSQGMTSSKAIAPINQSFMETDTHYIVDQEESLEELIAQLDKQQINRSFL
ncbi:MAG: type IV pilus twitching motility protein PilT, partial [Syntrophales bacterium]|nr:type IV pilus twitching motility protein PilT [Syntrophales bacterium]